MKKNMGAADRTIRFVLAAVVVLLYAAKIVTGTLGIVLMIVAVIFLVTTLFSFCPLYKILAYQPAPVKMQASDSCKKHD